MLANKHVQSRIFHTVQSGKTAYVGTCVQASPCQAVHRIPAICPIHDIVHQLVLTGDEKLLLVRNLKAGCSTVAHLLYQSSKKHPFQGSISDAPDLIRGIPHWPQIEPALTRPDVYRFTMARDPQTRAVSAFIDHRN